MTEKMKILIAYDGSSCADAALDDLRRAGLPRVAEAKIVTVAEIWLPHPSSYEVAEAAVRESVGSGLKKTLLQVSSAAGAVEDAHALALKAKERLQSHFSEWEVSAEALSGAPAWEILAAAERWNPDLILVGSQGRSALGRFFLGSVSLKVVNEARSSVRVARGNVWKYCSPVRIAIGVDGSPGSKAAVRAAAERAWPLESEARIIAVEDPIKPTALGRLVPSVAKWIGGSENGERAWVPEMVEAAAKELRAADLIVSSRIEEGDPKHVLVAEAEEWGADCIFVGSRGSHEPLAGLLLGSVSIAVVARALLGRSRARRVRRRRLILPTVAHRHGGVRRTFFQESELRWQPLV
jgi:nucleotide-binding universal stress UspA family protein